MDTRIYTNVRKSQNITNNESIEDKVEKVRKKNKK